MASFPADSSEPAVSDLNSIEGVAARLFLWGRRAPDGLARVTFDSDFSRLKLDERLSASCADASIPFHHVSLPQFTPAAEIVTWLMDKLRPLPHGIVSITGWATAFPDDVPLIDSLRVLNYNRENLAQFDLCQIWWLTRPLAGTFIREIPDLNSWFIVRLSLNENIVKPVEPTDALIHLVISAEAQEAARRQAADQSARLDKAIETGEDASAMIGLATVATILLQHGGFEEDAQIFALQSLGKIIDTLRQRPPRQPIERQAFSRVETWAAFLGRFGFDAPLNLTNIAFLFHSAGQHREAKTFYKAALDASLKPDGATSSMLHRVVEDLASLLREQGQYDEATALYKRVIANMKTDTPFFAYNLADWLDDLANIYAEQGKVSDAEELFIRVLAMQEQISSAIPHSVAPLLDRISEFYRSLGRFAEADMYEQRAKKVSFDYVIAASSS